MLCYAMEALREMMTSDKKAGGGGPADEGRTLWDLPTPSAIISVTASRRIAYMA